MNKPLMLMVLGLPLLSMSSARADDPGPCEQTANAWIQALEAGDFEAVENLYAAEDTFIALESFGNRRQGPAGLSAMWDEAKAEASFLSVELKPLALTERDAFAVCVGELEATTELHADHSRWLLRIQGTWVLEKQEKGWRIIHEHFSPIAGVERVQSIETP